MCEVSFDSRSGEHIDVVYLDLLRKEWTRKLREYESDTNHILKGEY
jgi:hypothetical protein